jgi:hypothetical protein
MTTLTDAERALFEWIERKYTSVMQALEHMAETNEKSAADTIDEAPAVARMLRESAASWRATAAELSKLYQQLPDEETPA